MNRFFLISSVLCLGLTVACGDKDVEDTAPEGDTDTDTDADSDTDSDTDADTDTDTDTDPVDEFEVLTTYMGDNDLDLPTMLDAWIVNGQDAFDAGLDNYFIVDLRTSDKDGNGVVDFEDGHIEGAHSVGLADVAEYVATNNTDSKQVLVVCYTGTTAGQATMGLRLLGHDAVSLKWGMSGWNSDFDLWTGNVGDAALDYDSWTMDTEVPALGSFDAPEISTGETEGEAILAAQLDARVWTETHKQVAADVLASPDDYQIFNYWGVEDWEHYGHIDGAFQLTPGEIGLDDLEIFDPGASIVIYCWSGQTAAMFESWLQALGYDAYTLLYSANGMIYSSLESHKWSASADLPYVTGA
jgi:rhodanese-related sulfurtransferase